MSNNKIYKIELSAEEHTLLDQISFTNFDQEILQKSCQASGKLLKLLHDRGAVPEIRIEYFTNPNHYNGKKSHKEEFESNGTKGSNIYYHGNFLKYLKYFIYGPDLPDNLMDEFCKEIDDDDLRAVARRLVRKYNLDSQKVFEEFYKLCIECKLSVCDSGSVRNSVRSVKTKKS
jgi:hypothetical protein